ncbi:MAG: hypothetical protein NVS9B1_27610 [Candidatus Dormibacteraceae bacterium]
MRRATIGWGAGSAAAYAVLLSRHYLGDGIRWYRPAIAPAPSSGGVNHLLYPALQWAWVHLLLAGGWPGTDAASTIALLQLLNAAAAGLAVAMFWLLLTELVDDRVAATLGTLLLATGFAFAQHATDMTEVMPSVAPSVAALWLAFRSWRPGAGRVTWLLAAALTASAASLYLGALVVAPAIALALFLSNSARGDGTEFPRRRIWPVLGYLGVAGAGLILVRIAAQVAGDPNAGDVTLQGTYGAVSVTHFAGLLFGFANSQAGLIDWRGGSRLLSAVPGPADAYNLLLTVISAGAAALLLGRSRRALIVAPRVRAASVVLLAWFGTAAALAGFWVNTYTKLWIPALAAWAALATLALSVEPRPRRLRLPAAAFVALVAVLSLGAHVLPNRLQPDPAVAEATWLGAHLGDRDLLLAVGWDRAGTDYAAMVGGHYLSYADEAYRVRLDQERLDRSVVQHVCAVLSGGGHVYTVGLVDLGRDNWDSFLGSRLHLRYDAIDRLRIASLPVPEAPGPEPVRTVGVSACS